MKVHTHVSLSLSLSLTVSRFFFIVSLVQILYAKRGKIEGEPEKGATHVSSCHGYKRDIVLILSSWIKIQCCGSQIQPLIVHDPKL